jgi:hypothetical protein
VGTELSLQRWADCVLGLRRGVSARHLLAQAHCRTAAEHLVHSASFRMAALLEHRRVRARKWRPCRDGGTRLK